MTDKNVAQLVPEQTPLPPFEGTNVKRSAVRITRAGGLSEALEVEPKAMHLGDEVAYVLRGTVSQVAHRTIRGAVTRLHTIEVASIAELPANIADGLLEQAHEALLRARDEKSGQTRIDGPGPVHQVAVDGTVVVPSDIGDPFVEVTEWDRESRLTSSARVV